jgi:hypothetical protein
MVGASLLAIWCLKSIASKLAPKGITLFAGRDYSGHGSR